MKFSIITFGCRVNQADSLAIENDFRARGAENARPEQADVIVVNSCSVTCSADQGTRQAIRRAVRVNPAAEVIVTGCYATRSPEEIRAIPGVARVVPNSDKDVLVQTAAGDRMSPRWTTAERYDPSGEGPCGLRLVPGSAGRTAFTLRVQTGCDEPCSYCIIPSTRGAPTSRPLDAIVRDIEHACAAGYREITLTGVHLGAYGRDLVPRRTLEELLGAVSTTTSDVIFRLGSLEPMDCTPGVIRRLADSDKFAHSLHLPLQHASPNVLRSMRRPYTIDEYERLVARLRRDLPDAALGSDIIVGFPGETERDFESLRAYVERSPLTYLHVFPYSDRPGTEASKLKGRVDGAAIRERARCIREIGRSLTDRFTNEQHGRTTRALVLDDGTYAVTRNGLKPRLSERRGRNEWVTINLRRAGDCLIGELACP